MDKMHLLEKIRMQQGQQKTPALRQEKDPGEVISMGLGQGVEDGREQVAGRSTLG